MNFVHLPYGTYDPYVFNDLGKNKVYENKLSKGDILVLWGGEDISTDFYGQKNVASWSRAPSRRDEVEWDSLVKAKEVDAKVLGICRGAQLVCVFNGGSLWQDVHHPSYHELLFRDGTRIVSNSLHHQMMDLRNLKKESYEIIAKTEGLSPHFVNDKGEFFNQEEPEIVFFKPTKSLCVQGHPEFMPKSKFTSKVKKLIKEYLNEDFRMA